MKEKLKYLFLLLIFIPKISISQAIPTFSAENRVNNISEIIPVKNKGFIKYKVTDSGDKTTIETIFYNLEASQVNNKKLELPLCNFIGFATNGTENHFLFYSKGRKELYVTKLDSNGKFITSLLFNTNATIKVAELIYYDSLNYYTSSKDRSTITFTKHNYKNDTIWQRKIQDNGETILIQDAKKTKELYISLNISRGNSRILAINDVNGEIIFDKRVGLPQRARTIRKLIVEDNEIVIAGDEFAGKLAIGTAEGLYMMKMDSIGNSRMDKFYSWSKINYANTLDTTYIGSRLDKIFIRDIIKVNNEYKILAETALRADKVRGEGFAIQLASMIVLTPFTGVVLGNYEVSKIATVDILLLTPDLQTDSLTLEKLAKEPIVRKYNFDTGPADQGRHFYYDKYKTFDYKFTYWKDNQVPELFYYYSLTSKEFTVAKATIRPRQEAEITKANIDMIFQPDFFNFYPLSDESVLVESNTKNSDGYKILKLSDFK